MRELLLEEMGLRGSSKNMDTSGTSENRKPLAASQTGRGKGRGQTILEWDDIFKLGRQATR